MLVHKGDKEGPVIATADLSRASEGVSVIEFAEPQSTSQLEHIHHRLPFTHSNTYFTFGGKKYHWKADAALIEDDTRICLAVYHNINLGGIKHKFGSIVFTTEGARARDVVAITHLVEHARSDEAKLEVRIRNKYVYANFSRSMSTGNTRNNLKLLLKSRSSCNDSSLKCQFINKL